MEQAPRNRDILLQACRIVIYFLVAAFALILVLLGAVSVYGAFANPDLAARMATQTILGLAMIGIVCRFLFQLGRIVDSVAKADPFSLANARRLREMGWLALAFQLVALMVHARGGDFKVIHLNGVEVLFSSAGGISLHGFLLTAVLFILARVFRKGADMRDELEGTV